MMFQYISCLRKCQPTCQFCCPPAGHVSPRLPVSTVVRERPDLKRKENHLALAPTPTPRFPDEQLWESSLLLPSNVQHVKDHKTQKIRDGKKPWQWDFIKLKYETDECWSTFFWAFVSWSLGLVSSFSLLYGFTALNLVPSLKS